MCWQGRVKELQSVESVDWVKEYKDFYPTEELDEADMQCIRKSPFHAPPANMCECACCHVCDLGLDPLHVMYAIAEFIMHLRRINGYSK